MIVCLQYYPPKHEVWERKQVFPFSLQSLFPCKCTINLVFTVTIFFKIKDSYIIIETPCTVHFLTLQIKKYVFYVVNIDFVYIFALIDAYPHFQRSIIQR